MYLDPLNRLDPDQPPWPCEPAAWHAAAAWLAARTVTELATLPDDRIDLGAGAFALPQSVTLRPVAEARWEAHRAHADIQLVLPGGDSAAETFGWHALADCTSEAVPFDAEADLGFYDPPDAPPVVFDLTPGRGVVFGPADVHAPCLAADADRVGATVRKLVVKVPCAASGRL